MRRVFVCLVLVFTAITVSGQESGNRIYGNYGYYQQQRRQLQTNSGMLGANSHGFAIEASVLTNLKPDAFVVVFGVNAEAAASSESNDKVTPRSPSFFRS